MISMQINDSNTIAATIHTILKPAKVEDLVVVSRSSTMEEIHLHISKVDSRSAVSLVAVVDLSILRCIFKELFRH